MENEEHLFDEILHKMSEIQAVELGKGFDIKSYGVNEFFLLEPFQ